MTTLDSILLFLWVIAVELRLHWTDKSLGLIIEMFERMFKRAKEKRG